MRFRPQKVLAVDMDGTLHNEGAPNEGAIAICREKKADGFALILWSSRGEAHAREGAERMGITALFDAIISKPGYVLDDKGWDWVRHTVVIFPPPRAEPP